MENSLVCYFLYEGGFNRSAIKEIVSELGYSERAIGFLNKVEYYREGTIVNFTSPAKGMMQIQAHSKSPIEDVLELRKNLLPNRVVNSNLEDIHIGPPLHPLQSRNSFF